MDWVKIEPGCEMPDDLEGVLISDGEDWKESCYAADRFHPVDSDGYVGMSDSFECVTHWARVELPNN